MRKNKSFRDKREKFAFVLYVCSAVAVYVRFVRFEMKKKKLDDCEEI